MTTKPKHYKREKDPPNPMPQNNPHNPVENVPADPDSDPSMSDDYLSYSSYLPNNKYYNQRLRTKNINKKLQSKT